MSSTQSLPYRPHPIGLRTEGLSPVHVWAMPALRSARVLLRAFRASDRSEFLERLDEARQELWQHLPLHRDGEGDAEVFERHVDESHTPRNGSWRLAVQNESGELVGGVNLVQIRGGLTLEADANWWIAPSFRRRGYASEAVQALVDVALADFPRGLGLGRVNAMIQSSNVPSVRVAHRVGFRRVPDMTASVEMHGVPVCHHLYVCE